MLNDSRIMTTVPCVDLECARDFYGNTLGLKEMEIPEGLENENYPIVGYVCGNGSLLGVYQRPTPTKADHTVANWFVDNVDATVDALTARGVKFETYDMPGVEFDARGVATMGGFKTAWFKDPEGNIFSINEMPGM